MTAARVKLTCSTGFYRLLLLTLFTLLPHVVMAVDHSNQLGLLQVYVRDGCPHCAEAKKFLPQPESRYFC